MLSVFTCSVVVYIDVIGPEKAEFICELLSEVGRKDLTVVVREYIDKVDRKLCLHRERERERERGPKKHMYLRRKSL